ncbi:MAG: nucleotidyl transferase AbiEii/AbiGii toxin family protein [Clostridia bacterium]|nr:nucleotidyl transferase AbiEii/AbiGii toxin family protein [Clostridia bacterium]NCC75587.1 nucleotidyl transferase AbiEii/AbiGii toxin family protein [Clostridia bacterium]
MDRGASILSKLKNKAKTEAISYQHCLQLFFQEEFLRRLSKSHYMGNFVLKGGLFIYTLTGFESRATVDIDFLLRQMDSDPRYMDGVIAEILTTPTGNNDVVILEAKKFEQITPHREYPGVSTQIIGRIKNVRVPFNVDIGVGDVIVPAAEKRQVNTQLADFESPVIMTYSIESVIAEKLDAILQRLELTGRMKDFYDLYYLARKFNFSGEKLQKAIAETLRTRKTVHDEKSFDRIIELKFNPDMHTKWRYFLKTIGDEHLQFEMVISQIEQLLSPIYSAMVKGERLNRNWDSQRNSWVSN